MDKTKATAPECDCMIPGRIYPKDAHLTTCATKAVPANDPPLFGCAACGGKHPIVVVDGIPMLHRDAACTMGVKGGQGRDAGSVIDCGAVVLWAAVAMLILSLAWLVVSL